MVHLKMLKIFVGALSPKAPEEAAKVGFIDMASRGDLA